MAIPCTVATLVLAFGFSGSSWAALAAWAFATHWAGDWLRRAIRLAPAPVRPISIVIG